MPFGWKKVKSLFMMFPANGFHCDKRDLREYLGKGFTEYPLDCAYWELIF